MFILNIREVETTNADLHNIHSQDFLISFTITEVYNHVI
jgi:hypothetical protein